MSSFAIFLSRLGYRHGRDTCKPGEAKALLDALNVLVETSYWIRREPICDYTPTGLQVRMYRNSGTFRLEDLPKAEAAYARLNPNMSFLAALERADETALLSIAGGTWDIDQDTFEYIQGQITDELRFFAKTHATSKVARDLLDEIESEEGGCAR